jgi:hypothetical protein
MREHQTVPDDRLRPHFVATLGERIVELQAALATEWVSSEKLRLAVSNYVRAFRERGFSPGRAVRSVRRVMEAQGVYLAADGPRMKQLVGWCLDEYRRLD